MNRVRWKSLPASTASDNGLATERGAGVCTLPAALAKLLCATIISVGSLIQSTAGADQSPGPTVMVGGMLRYDNSAVWSSLVELAGGNGARFVVLPSATGRPRLYGGYAVRALQRHGAIAELLPVAPETAEFGIDYREAIHDAALLAKIRLADGIFFTGGAPQRIAQVLYQDDGTDTPMLAAIRKRHAEGAVIAGANPGRIVIGTGIGALPAMRSGLPEQAARRGLGLFEPDWLVDQHLFSHGRFAVSLVAMHSLGLHYGLGIDVNTAVIVTDGTRAEVIGPGGALLIDLTRASTDASAAPFTLTGARLSYLGHGDHLDLTTLRITPSASKLDGFEVDPNADDHTPWYEGPAFYPDVFAPSNLINLMFSAVDGSARQGLGLAFAPDLAEAGSGFQFRFYPGADSAGWFDGIADSSDYTVSNVYLDVLPATDTYLKTLTERHESRAR